jgi:hypothetical protein
MDKDLERIIRKAGKTADRIINTTSHIRAQFHIHAPATKPMEMLSAMQRFVREFATTECEYISRSRVRMDCIAVLKDQQMMRVPLGRLFRGPIHRWPCTTCKARKILGIE